MSIIGKNHYSPIFLSGVLNQSIQTSERTASGLDSYKSHLLQVKSSKKLSQKYKDGIVVFPNILKRTKKNIENYRKEHPSSNESSLIAEMEIINNQKLQNAQSLIMEESPKKLSPHREILPKVRAVQSQFEKQYEEKLKTEDQSQSLSLIKILFTNQDSNQQNDSNIIYKFEDQSSQTIQQNEVQWKINQQKLKMNKAYIIQQSHQRDKNEQLWQPDVIQKILQHKLIQTGFNIKAGLKQIFIIFFSHSDELSPIDMNNLRIVEFYTPVYRKILNRIELQDDFKEWCELFLEIIKLKKKQQFSFWFLDGQRLQNLAEISQYDKFFFFSLTSDFDFWTTISSFYKFRGQFSVSKFPRLMMKLFDLTNKETILKFFMKKENLKVYFDQVKEFKSMRVISQRDIINPEKPDLQIDEETYEMSVFHMNPEIQQAFLEEIQQNLYRERQKYSKTLNNQEMAMRHRIEVIKKTRNQNLEPNQIKRKNKRRLTQIKLNEEQHYERKLLNEDIQSIEDIKEYALDHADIPMYIEKKFSQKKIPINDAFDILTQQDNKQFANIMNFINIDKIMLDKNLSRQDVINYLTVFKALQDSEILPPLRKPAELSQLYQATDQNSENISQQGDLMKAPKLYISLKQLRRALPYLALYRNNINTRKLNDIFKNQRFKYVSFLDFLDIFSTQGEEGFVEAEILDNKAFI